MHMSALKTLEDLRKMHVEHGLQALQKILESSPRKRLNLEHAVHVVSEHGDWHDSIVAVKLNDDREVECVFTDSDLTDELLEAQSTDTVYSVLYDLMEKVAKL